MTAVTPTSPTAYQLRPHRRWQTHGRSC